MNCFDSMINLTTTTVFQLRGYYMGKTIASHIFKPGCNYVPCKWYDNTAIVLSSKNECFIWEISILLLHSPILRLIFLIFIGEYISLMDAKNKASHILGKMR